MQPSTEVAGGALVVAAGYSRRFGTDKRLHLLPSRDPMLVATLRRYCAVFANVAVVVRSDDERIARLLTKELARGAPRIVTTEHASLGMGHSLADGVRSVSGWEFVFVALGDMPFVSEPTLERLLLRMSELRGPRIIVPMHRSTAGHPVGFSRDFFGELAALTGDRGARQVIASHADALHHVETDDPGVLLDVDRVDSLDQAASAAAGDSTTGCGPDAELDGPGFDRRPR